MGKRKAPRILPARIPREVRELSLSNFKNSVLSEIRNQNLSKELKQWLDEARGFIQNTALVEEKKQYIQEGLVCIIARVFTNAKVGDLPYSNYGGASARISEARNFLKQNRSLFDKLRNYRFIAYHAQKFLTSKSKYP